MRLQPSCTDDAHFKARDHELRAAPRDRHTGRPGPAACAPNPASGYVGAPKACTDVRSAEKLKISSPMHLDNALDAQLHQPQASLRPVAVR